MNDLRDAVERERAALEQLEEMIESERKLLGSASSRSTSQSPACPWRDHEASSQPAPPVARQDHHLVATLFKEGPDETAERRKRAAEKRAAFLAATVSIESTTASSSQAAQDAACMLRTLPNGEETWSRPKHRADATAVAQNFTTANLEAWDAGVCPAPSLLRSPARTSPSGWMGGHLTGQARGISHSPPLPAPGRSVYSKMDMSTTSEVSDGGADEFSAWLQERQIQGHLKARIVSWRQCVEICAAQRTQAEAHQAVKRRARSHVLVRMCTSKWRTVTSLRLSAHALCSRHDRRLHILMVVSWARRAHRKDVLRQKSGALAVRLQTRKGQNFISCWFYRASCVRGARLTRHHAFCRAAKSLIRAWQAYTKAETIRTMKEGRGVSHTLASWRSSMHDAAAAWDLLGDKVRQHVDQADATPRCLRLSSTWKACALLKSCALKLGMERRRAILNRWWDSVQQGKTRHIELEGRISQSKDLNDLNKAVATWRHWLTIGNTRRDLHAECDRARLEAFCRAWNHEVRLSCRYRAEISFMIWRAHAQLRASIISFIYRRGVSRARHFSRICLGQWRRRAKRYLASKRAQEHGFFGLSMLACATKTWSARAKLEKLQRRALAQMAISARTTLMKNGMLRWRYVHGLKGAHEHIIALKSIRLVARLVAAWKEWCSEMQMLMRAVAQRQRRRMLASIPSMLLRWLHHARYRLLCENVVRNVRGKHLVGVMHAVMDTWFLLASIALEHTQRCTRMKRLHLQRVLSKCFVGMSNAAKRAKRYCAIQVLIVRSSIAATTLSVIRMWYSRVQEEFTARRLISARNSRVGSCILAQWLALALDSRVHEQKLMLVKDRSALVREEACLQLWRARVRHKIEIEQQLNAARLAINKARRVEAWWAWMLVSAFKSSALVKLADACQKRNSRKIERIAMKRWKFLVCKEKSDLHVLRKEQRRKADRAVMLALYHWRLTLGAQRQMWSSFERLRLRWRRGVLRSLLHVWRSELAVPEDEEDANLTGAPKTMFDPTRLHEVLRKMAQQMSARRISQRLLGIILRWRQHSDVILEQLRAEELRFRDDGLAMLAACIRGWARLVANCSRRCSKRRSSDFEDAYIRAKGLKATSQRLRMSLTVWTDRIIRKNILDDWTINLYSKKRLNRIEHSVRSRHLLALARLAFAQFANASKETKNFYVRAEFACTRGLVPASPWARSSEEGAASGAAGRTVPKTPAPLPPAGRFDIINDLLAPSYLQAQVARTLAPKRTVNIALTSTYVASHGTFAWPGVLDAAIPGPMEVLRTASLLH